MKKYLSGILAVVSVVYGSEPSSIKKNGFIINIGGASGPGFGYSDNFNPRFQIRTLVGYVKSETTVGITIEPSGQKQDVKISVSGLSALLGARLYPVENLYIGSGLAFINDRAEFDFNNPNTGKNENGKGGKPIFVVPLNIGGEIARYSILSGYVEMSNNFTLNNQKPGTKVSSENLSLRFFNELYEWKIGLGASINWGGLK